MCEERWVEAAAEGDGCFSEARGGQEEFGKGQVGLAAFWKWGDKKMRLPLLPQHPAIPMPNPRPACPVEKRASQPDEALGDSGRLAAAHQSQPDQAQARGRHVCATMRHLGAMPLANKKGCKARALGGATSRRVQHATKHAVEARAQPRAAQRSTWRVVEKPQGQEKRQAQGIATRMVCFQRRIAHRICKLSDRRVLRQN